MPTSQVHFRHEAPVLLGTNPEIGFNVADRLQEKQDTKAHAFQEVVDHYNRNDAYASELALTEEYFDKHGIDINPLRVVTIDTLARAKDAAGEATMDMNGEGGEHLYERACVIESKENIELMGRDLVLSVLLHEGAHSVAGGEHNIAVTREELGTYSDGRPRVIRKLGGVAHLGGFGKADFRARADTPTTGGFWLEAFADLTRVKALREMGRSSRIQSHTKRTTAFDGQPINILAKNSVGPMLDSVDQAVALPAEFLMAAKPNFATHRTATATAAPNFAAFGLELLDKHIPGLYDTMLAGQREPLAQAAFIRQLESVRPGLYRELGTLEYTDKSFASGVLLIADALGIKDEMVTG